MILLVAVLVVSMPFDVSIMTSSGRERKSPWIPMLGDDDHDLRDGGDNSVGESAMTMKEVVDDGDAKDFVLKV